MSGGIEFQPNNQTQGIIQNPGQLSEQNIQLIEYLIEASSDENGAVFFNLDWQNQRAEALRQTLTTIFSTISTEQNQTENLTNRAWRDLINLAREHNDFKEFRRQPENFWQQVRQMSETRIVKDNAGRETRTASRFNELLEKMQSKNLSPREFAQTLPPNERAVFKACYQLSQTFGANLFNNGATPNEAAQTKFSEIPTDTSRAAVLREGKFILPGATTRGEMLFGAKSAALLGASILTPQNFKGSASGNPAMQNTALPTASPTALGSAAGASLIVPETSAARGLTNAASENTTNTNAARRDGGTAIGGALISGAFASIDNHKNLDYREIGDSRAKGSVFGEGSGFAAGATGAMFGAAVGTVIPGAETVVSGVLGFVSSVVVGVDIDQGLRWLGTGITFNATAADNANPNNQKQLTTGDSYTPNSNLQLAPA